MPYPTEHPVFMCCWWRESNPSRLCIELKKAGFSSITQQRQQFIRVELPR